MAVRMADVKNLKSALLYALKVEAATQASCIDRHSIRGATVTADAPSESPWRKEIKKLKEEIQDLVAQRHLRSNCSQNNKEDRSTKCWGCGKAGHLRNNCPRVNQEHPHRANVIESKEVCGNLKGSAEGNEDAFSRRPCPESCKYCSRIEKKFGVIDPIVRQVTTPSTSALDPWSDESVRKDQLADPEIKPIMEFKESSDEKPSWEAPFHPTTKCYWALWNFLHVKNGVLYRKWESDDGKTFRWQLILPKTRVSTVLKELHGSPTGGHFGVMKTLQKVR
ncbi:integrase_H2C2 domain-containing protein [Trichonephila clavipes]|nr:integrase_H2C2 domain-containing protein [Trichonephila clavipes]